ncbi:TraX family protein [uncultured Oscillibacter sp.]|uniref:TraX family protein n=1 Tax=uncultured Oscillibacter sp. TaxID=876091 RepID=UPI0025FA38E9|nr:TraX family protein [uncultured Oscillibacter sp.]
MNIRQLKLFAVACMIFDHAVRIFPMHEWLLPLAVRVEAAHPALAVWILDDLTFGLNFIGRLAAPIFLFCIAQGFLHTHSVKRYLGRLLTAALAAQIPYVLFDLAEIRLYGATEDWWTVPLNILFTLTLGLAALAVYRQCAAENRRWLGLLAVGAAAGLARLAHMEGKEGYILLIFLFYLLRNLPRWQQALLFLPAVALSRWGLVLWVITEPSAGAVTNSVINILGNYLGVLVTLFHNGAQGKTSRAFRLGMYAFYPAHLALLALVGFLRPPLV